VVVEITLEVKMSKYELNGVHVLNKFVWDNLKNAGLLDEIDYSGLVPIIPTQQVPVFNDMAAGKPFIVYTFILSAYDQDLWANVEQVTYRIYSDDEAKLRRVVNFLVDLLSRLDWTAADVNRWIDRSNTADGDEKKFEFKYVNVVGGSGAEPFAQEGGRQDATVTVRMAFTVDSNPAAYGEFLGMRV
jgi:hypothetical protein